MEIGKKIAFLRKQQNLTQEYLAKEVGVSVPAVSKWETGAASPDISLLMPIARTLHTDVNDLFSFRKDISEREVDDFMAELQEICVKQGYREGMERAFKLQKEYPDNNYLKLKTANAVTMYAFTAKENDEEEMIFQKYFEQSTHFLEEVYRDEKLYDKFGYRHVAAIALSARYIQYNKLQEAEHILKNIPSGETEIIHILARVYLKQGNTKEARKCISQTKVRDLVNLLADNRILFDVSVKEGNLTEALSLAKEHYQIRKAMPILIFGYGYPSELLVDVFLYMNDLEQAAEHFFHLVDEMLETAETFQENSEILSDGFNMYRIAAENPLYQPLLEQPECKKKLEELKRKVETKSPS